MWSGDHAWVHETLRTACRGHNIAGLVSDASQDPAGWSAGQRGAEPRPSRVRRSWPSKLMTVRLAREQQDDLQSRTTRAPNPLGGHGPRAVG